MTSHLTTRRRVPPQVWSIDGPRATYGEATDVLSLSSVWHANGKWGLEAAGSALERTGGRLVLSVSVDESTGSPLCSLRPFVLAASRANAAVRRARAACVDANAALMAEKELKPDAVRAAGDAAWAAAAAALEPEEGALTEVGTPLETPLPPPPLSLLPSFSDLPP